MSPPLAADRIGDALSGIASALAVPVQVAALALLLALAFELGRGVAEAWRRLLPGRPTLLELADRALADPAQGRALARLVPSAIAGRALAAIADAVGSADRDAVEHALTDYELAVQRRLDRTRMLVRAGPAVGLMGTLIPLAPGLAALGRGDIAGLAADLQTAFAATVVGLLVGTAAFALTLVRTRRATEDLAALERAVANAAEGRPAAVAAVAEQAA